MSVNSDNACNCDECYGGCDNIGLNQVEDGVECDECGMGLHRQDRDNIQDPYP